MKNDQKRLYDIFHNPTVWGGSIILSTSMMLVFEYEVAQAFYIYVLGLAELAPLLSLSMASIYGILSHTASILLAKRQKREFAITVIFYLVLMVFAFFGLEAAAIEKANDPLNILLGDTQDVSLNNTHYIITGLAISLWSISVLLGYLRAKGKEDIRHIKDDLEMSTLLRESEYQIDLKEGEVARAKVRLDNAAAEPVYGRIQNLEDNLNSYKRTEHRLNSEKNYKLQSLELTYRQVRAAIKAVYAKKSFIKSLFTKSK